MLIRSACVLRLATGLAFGLGIGVSGCSHPVDADPVGLWNLKFGEQSQRATGRIRTVLLRLEEIDGEFEGELTSIRDTFLPVDGLRVAGGEMSFGFGAYEYTLELDGDRVTGTVVSPLGTQEVSGSRQDGTLMYDRPEEFRTQREGVIGHRIELAPPEEEQDPAAWVLGRVQSPEDLALIVFLSNHKVAVSFVNAEDFEMQLRAHAGQRVKITAVWEADKLRLESIEAAD